MAIALIVFSLAYLAIASERLPRHWVALGGGAALIAFGVLSPLDALGYVSWETLGLLLGMFVLVALLHEAGFFAWLAMTAVRKVNYHPAALFVALALLAAACSMVMDSITVMLFLSALTLQLCRLLKTDPVPVVIAEVCMANTGGAATLVGDPPNVILGTALGFNFNDFAVHTGPISLVAALSLLGMFYLVNRVALADARTRLGETTVREIEALHSEPLHARMTRVGLTCFGAAVLLLVLHKAIESWTGLPVNPAAAALLPAGLALALLPGIERKVVVRKVDYHSLLFFAGLFVLIGGLEKTRFFEMLARTLSDWTAASPTGLVVALHWGPGLLSGVVDNVPLALAMSYVLKDLARIPGTPALALMVWSLALGVDIGGNLTPIGASANVVAYTALEHEHGKVGWARWITLALPPTLAVMLLASALIVLKGIVFWY